MLETIEAIEIIDALLIETLEALLIEMLEASAIEAKYFALAKSKLIPKKRFKRIEFCQLRFTSSVSIFRLSKTIFNLRSFIKYEIFASIKRHKLVGLMAITYKRKTLIFPES